MLEAMHKCSRVDITGTCCRLSRRCKWRGPGTGTEIIHDLETMPFVGTIMVFSLCMADLDGQFRHSWI